MDRPDLIIGTREVARRIGRHVITIYKKIRINPQTGQQYDPAFPPPFLINKRLGWRESWIENYLRSRPRKNEAA